MAYRLGIDFGGTGIKAGVVDENYNIIAKHSVPTRSELGFDRVAADMADLALELSRRQGLSISDYAAIGVGTPSYVDPRTDKIVFVNNANFKNVPLRAALYERLHTRVHICNDGNCAVAGELLAGAARGLDNVLMLTLGTGVGSGVIIDRKIFGGCDNMGAELGHTQFLFGGEECTCGMTGCFEAYASVTALINQTRAMIARRPESAMAAHVLAHGGQITGRTAFDCMRLGDEGAQQVVDAYIEYVAAGLGSFINIFRPDAALIGGGLSNEGETLLAPLNARVASYVLSCDLIGAPPILKAELGNDAGIIGAAFLDQV